MIKLGLQSVWSQTCGVENLFVVALHTREMGKLTKCLTVRRHRAQMLEKILINWLCILVRLYQQRPRAEVYRAVEFTVAGVLGVKAADLGC